MNTLQIQQVLQDVNSFLGVYASDLLPLSIVQTGTSLLTLTRTQSLAYTGRPYISKTLIEPQTATFSIPTAAILLFPPSKISYDVIVQSGNTTTQLQGPTTTVCGEYCCLFALYMDRGYTPQQFVGLFTAENADRNIHQLFCSEFGSGGQCCTSLYKR